MGQLPRGTWACKPGGEQDHADVQTRGPVLSFAVWVWASGSDFKCHPGSSLSRVTSGDPEQPASCLSTYGVGAALPAGGSPAESLVPCSEAEHCAGHTGGLRPGQNSDSGGGAKGGGMLGQVVQPRVLSLGDLRSVARLPWAPLHLGKEDDNVTQTVSKGGPSHYLPPHPGYSVTLPCPPSGGGPSPAPPGVPGHLLGPTGCSRSNTV